MSFRCWRMTAVVLGLLVAAPARGAGPGAAHARRPADLGLQAEDVSFPAADSMMIAGWWFGGPPDAPVIVVPSRGTDGMSEMLPAVKEFHARGFQLLTFDYHGLGADATAGARDSARYVVLSSWWVDDMVGALAYARKRGGHHVFAWGQERGSAVAVASAARDAKLCDGLAVEGLFRTTQEFLLSIGTSVIPGVEVRQRQLVRPGDEPMSAASRLRVPIFAVLAGRDTLTPPALTRGVVSRDRVRADVWLVPGAGHTGAEQTPGYFDRLARWFKQWTALPPGQAK